MSRAVSTLMAKVEMTYEEMKLVCALLNVINDLEFEAYCGTDSRALFEALYEAVDHNIDDLSNTDIQKLFPVVQ